MPQASRSGPRFEDSPLTRPEYISAMVHFYRGELTRSISWRVRLDTSTNWAIFAVTAILTFAFGSPQHSHASIILGMLLVFNFLALEAKRFRIFDVWRNRVRMIEENFYGPLLTRDLESPRERWGSLVAADLLEPRFKITYLQALRARFVSNYALIFGLLLLAWSVKVASPLHAVEGGALERLAVGRVSGVVPLCIVAALYLFFIAIVLLVPRVPLAGTELWTGEGRGGLAEG
ncbi:MAG: DUF2270 domain-containing protein [Candidatus Latescibacterota bacterium]|nr:MAG: DUF2270 domain-containing protein [Candidatus Latescibacterota bacterium]